MYVAIGDNHYLIESRSKPGDWHCTELDEASGRWVCCCLGNIRWGKCWHVQFMEALSDAKAGRLKRPEP